MTASTPPTPLPAPPPGGSPLLVRAVGRWPAFRPFLTLGVLAIVGGGVVAALTRPADLELGPWSAAFLVLVGGIAQVGVGLGWAWLATAAPTRRSTLAEVVLWNVGVAGTIAGTLSGSPAITSVAGVVLVVALVRALRQAWHPDRAATPAWLAHTALALLAVVAISTPVGLALAWARHG